MSYSENYSDESISLNGGSNSGNEADFKRVEVYDKDIKKILSMRKIVNSSMYEPEKEIFSTSLSSESDYSGNSSNSNQLENAEVGNFNWCICGNCVSKKKRDWLSVLLQGTWVCIFEFAYLYCGQILG